MVLLAPGESRGGEREVFWMPVFAGMDYPIWILAFAGMERGKVEQII
jgi:hypothetical protein